VPAPAESERATPAPPARGPAVRGCTASWTPSGSTLSSAPLGESTHDPTWLPPSSARVTGHSTSECRHNCAAPSASASACAFPWPGRGSDGGRPASLFGDASSIHFSPPIKEAMVLHHAGQGHMWPARGRACTPPPGACAHGNRNWGEGSNPILRTKLMSALGRLPIGFSFVARDPSRSIVTAVWQAGQGFHDGATRPFPLSARIPALCCGESRHWANISAVLVAALLIFVGVPPIATARTDDVRGARPRASRRNRPTAPTPTTPTFRRCGDRRRGDAVSAQPAARRLPLLPLRSNHELQAVATTQSGAWCAHDYFNDNSPPADTGNADRGHPLRGARGEPLHRAGSRLGHALRRHPRRAWSRRG